MLTDQTDNRDQDGESNVSVFARIMEVDPEVAEIAVNELGEGLHEVVCKAEKIRDARIDLLERIPGLNQVNMDDWDADIRKRGWGPHNTILSEYYIRLTENSVVDDPRIFAVMFYNIDSVVEGIVNGFYVRCHKNPKECDHFDEAFEEKWVDMTNTDEFTRKLIGIALHKMAADYINMNPANVQVLFDRIPIAH